MKNKNNKNNIDIGLLITRIAIGGLMLFHGIHKLKDPAQTIAHLSDAMAQSGLPEFLSYGVFLGEFISPILVLVGWRTKIFAPFIAITMLVAIYTRHATDIFALTDNGGLAIEFQALFLLGAISLAFTGAGRYAVSHKTKWD